MMHTSVDRYMHRLQFNPVREHSFHFVVAKGDRKIKDWKQYSRSRTDLDNRPFVHRCPARKRSIISKSNNHVSFFTFILKF